MVSARRFLGKRADRARSENTANDSELKRGTWRTSTRYQTIRIPRACQTAGCLISPLTSATPTRLESSAAVEGSAAFFVGASVDARNLHKYTVVVCLLVAKEGIQGTLGPPAPPPLPPPPRAGRLVPPERALRSKHNFSGRDISGVL